MGTLPQIPLFLFSIVECPVCSRGFDAVDCLDILASDLVETSIHHLKGITHKVVQSALQRCQYHKEVRGHV